MEFQFKEDGEERDYGEEQDGEYGEYAGYGEYEEDEVGWNIRRLLHFLILLIWKIEQIVQFFIKF